MLRAFGTSRSHLGRLAGSIEGFMGLYKVGDKGSSFLFCLLCIVYMLLNVLYRFDTFCNVLCFAPCANIVVVVVRAFPIDMTSLEGRLIQ